METSVPGAQCEFVGLDGIQRCESPVALFAPGGPRAGQPVVIVGVSLHPMALCHSHYTIWGLFNIDKVAPATPALVSPEVK
jgi:hypothetical protein